MQEVKNTVNNCSFHFIKLNCGICFVEISFLLLLHFDLCNCLSLLFVTFIFFSIAILCPMYLHAKVLPWQFSSHLTSTKNEFVQRSEQWPSKYFEG